MDRGYQGLTKVTNPDKARLQAGVKWLTPHPSLREVSASKMIVYLRVKNTSGSPVPIGQLRASLMDGLEAAGYRIVRDPEEASFAMRVDVRGYGENRQKDMGAGALASTVIGGVAGAAAGHAIGGDGRATGLGAAGGALLGAGLANIMANRNKMVEIDMVVDVRIGERIKGGVKTTRSSEDGTHVHHQDRTAVAGGGVEGGGSKGGSSDRQQVELKEDFLYHKNRLVAHAVKMNLTPEEALPVVSQKLASALSSILP